MRFLLNWLFWCRAAKKQQDKLDKTVEELSKNKVIGELANGDPEMREALRSLGVKNHSK